MKAKTTLNKTQTKLFEKIKKGFLLSESVKLKSETKAVKKLIEFELVECVRHPVFPTNIYKIKE